MQNNFYEDPQAITIGKIIVVLYIVGIIFPVLFLIGIVMAYVFRQDANGWMSDNFRYLIRTFWLGLLYGVIAALLCPVGIGILLIPIVILWWILRVVVCFRAIQSGYAHRHPGTWVI